MAVSAPERLYFTNSDEANALIAREPLALLVGFVLDQQVSVQTAFIGPLKIKERLGTLEAGDIASTDPDRLEAVFRERPAVHRFPGSMATRVRDLSAHIEAEYGGDAARLWQEAGDATELRRRIETLPGFGEMKVKALSAVLAKRFGVETAQELAPTYPTLGDVDSREALENYQALKREWKAKMRAESL
ncbi:MAG TPA: HhH-GPD-type base excision DNA repair protein [Gaiellaceae bacterium]|nr:HhH-GPD-type base excision DNA repair protein [Gaiellaceae bacterium]